MPILATKLYIPPPRPQVIVRPRLIERLDEGVALGCKLTLVSASAGFGKTTLVSDWVSGCKQAVARCGKSVAWLSLNEGDNDPAGFLAYVIAALQTIAPDIGAGVLRMLQSPQPAPIETMAIALLNEISAVRDNFVLVLDDYHMVDSNAVDDVLAFVIEHLPPQMHLVIASREDPHLPLARLRARGQLSELRAADLRFTAAEASDFLNRVAGLNLSAEDIGALETRTEGWIAGLQLAALSMQGRSDAAGFIKSFTGSHHFILDYLVEEVLQRQPEPVRNFLLQTAILDRLTSSLCDAVTEQEDGRGKLEALERGNLFVIPLDDQRQWYRYHHLFAEVLQAHLQEAQPERVAMLHQRASAWYERNGLRADAIRHALAGKDFGRAAALIELAWPAAEAGSIQPAAWLGWVKRLPDGLIDARPVLNVDYAYALLGRGEMEAAQARLTQAERWLAAETPSVEMVVADGQQLAFLPAAIAVGRAFIAQAGGNMADTIRYARQVLELAPEGDDLRHGQASMLLGLTYWASGEMEDAERVFADYSMKLRIAGNIPDAIGTSAVLADIRLALGRLQAAIDGVEQCLQFVIDQGEPIALDTADLHRALSDLYLEQGNAVAAGQHLQRGQELGEKAELPVLRYRLCIAQARFEQSQANLEGAVAMLDKAQRLYIRSPLPDVAPIAAMQARIWVAQGKWRQALAWAREQGLSPDDALSYLREFEHITLARILMAQYQHDRTAGSIDAVMQFLERLLQAAQAGRRMGSVIEILALQALAYQAQGEIMPARVALERALTLAEPEGYVRVFIDEGERMAALLADVGAKGETLLAKQAVGPQALAGRKSLIELALLIESASLIEPLSEREMEVLKLLRSELSGPEIAHKLIVSLSTVRTHTQKIYAKLGVNNRRAAVRRAEELDLL